MLRGTRDTVAGPLHFMVGPRVVAQLIRRDTTATPLLVVLLLFLIIILPLLGWRRETVELSIR